MMKESRFFYLLSLSRFMAALTVVFYHYGIPTLGKLPQPLSIIINNGGIAVSYFFVLSGFVLAASYFSVPVLNVKEYTLKRIARIFPLYLLSFLAVLLLMYLRKGTIPHGDSIILQMCMLQAWRPGIIMEINYVAWSVSVECFFYLIFPFLLPYMKKLSTKRLLVFTAIIWVLNMLIHYTWLKTIWGPDRFNVGQFIAFFPPWHTASFITGMCTFLILQKNNFFDKNWVRYSVILGIMSIVFTALFLQYCSELIPYFTNSGFAPLFACYIAFLAILNPVVKWRFLQNALNFSGNISYGIYLLQWAVVLLFLVTGIVKSDEELKLNYFYNYLLVLLVLAGIVYYLWERNARLFILKFKRELK